MFSEVIYNKDNYAKVMNVIDLFLKKDGVCYMANKLFYFGVGGSLPEFKDFIDLKYGNKFSWETAKFINTK